MKPVWIIALATMVMAGTARPSAAQTMPHSGPDYEDYGAALMSFVDANGLVDYASLQQQRVYLDDFVTYLERLDPKTYESWPGRDKIAFWINAYNGLTLRAIIDHYPIVRPAGSNAMYPANSIRQIPGVWDVARVKVMGDEITLQYIETKILRRDFHEPRIHMALVCAALSCPKLRNDPYVGAVVNAQLNDQTRTFLADPRHFHIDRAKKEVQVSEIFRWYADDFAPASAPRGNAAALERSGLVSFVSPFLNEADRAFLAGNDYRITYTPYDWTLNEQKQ